MRAKASGLAGLVLWLALLVAVGPVALLAVLLLLAPPVRRAVRSLHPLRLTLGAVVLGLAVVGAVLVLPTGALPIPSGPGLLVTPRSIGGPSDAEPVTPVPVPPHPHLAGNGRSNMHNDPYATDAYPWAGPTGRDLEVDTAWFGVEECATLAFDSRDRIVALCGDLSGPTLRVLDPETMRPLDTVDLPDRPESDVPPWQNLCAGSYFFLDADDRAVLATTDQRVLVFATRRAGAGGEPRPGRGPAGRRLPAGADARLGRQPLVRRRP